MKLILTHVLSIFLLALPMAAGTFSYIVVQEQDRDSLIRVSADGKTVTTIANGASGVDVAIEKTGNYIVASKGGLLRVTRSGEVTTIAKAPPESTWVSVVVDQTGSLIVADGKKPILWRVSPDGRSVAKFAEFTGVVTWSVNEIGLLVEPSGDILALGYYDRRGIFKRGEELPYLFRVSPAGEIIRTPLDGAAPLSSGRMVTDGPDGFVYLDNPDTRKLLRLSRSGRVTDFANVTNRICCMTGLVRSPQSGDFTIATVSRLLQVSADGKTDWVFCYDPKLRFSRAIVVEEHEIEGGHPARGHSTAR